MIIKQFKKRLIIFRRFALVLGLLLFFNSHGYAAPFTVGEELVYKVTWMKIHLAKVTIQVGDSLQYDGKKVYHAKFLIDSNPRLFFINIHSSFESYIDENFYPQRYQSHENDNGLAIATTYRFNYQENLIDVKIVTAGKTTSVVEKAVAMEGRVFDGLSLLGYLRNQLTLPKTEQFTIISDGKLWRLDLTISERRKKLALSSLNQECDAYQIKGQAHFTSVAGVTGGFRAWFAADDQSPLLVAELKVFIGHVRLTLESWKHWDPTPNNIAEL